ncbi:hypothetical protein [Nocardioides marmoriginsengisoli]|uniref:hypothetical protein n=1 Tax=Nocardioides marmoriginsengisoli TaxID=661483 RepID=UPI0011CE31A3|nr:hypothetical protein [Nocardioides marmoriginsengisoli]
MTEDLERLGREVKARRRELRLSQMDVWKKRRGPSSTKLGDIESGEPPSPSSSTKEKLEAALEWEPGSVDRILDGGDPSPVPSSKVRHESQAAVTERADSLVDGLAETLRAAIEAAVLKALLDDPAAMAAIVNEVVKAAVQAPGGSSSDSSESEVATVELAGEVITPEPDREPDGR